MAFGGGADVSYAVYSSEMKRQASKVAAEFDAAGLGDIAFQIDDLLDFSNEDIAGPIDVQLSDDTGDSSLTSMEAASSTSSAARNNNRLHTPNVLDEDTRKTTSDDLCVPVSHLLLLHPLLSSFCGLRRCVCCVCVCLVYVLHL